MELKKSNLSCLKIGNIGEELVCRLLDNAKIKYKKVSKENRSFYDLTICLRQLSNVGEMINRLFTFEIKYDFYQKKSENLAIEVFNTRSNKKSGLSITKADFWIHILDEDNILLTQVYTLKDFIQNNKPARVIEKAGDNNARLYLYPKDIILPIFTNISGFSKRRLLRIIYAN